MYLLWPVVAVGAVASAMGCWLEIGTLCLSLCPFIVVHFGVATVLCKVSGKSIVIAT